MLGVPFLHTISSECRYYTEDTVFGVKNNASQRLQPHCDTPFCVLKTTEREKVFYSILAELP